MTQTPPLAGLHVLELSGHVAGAYCGKLMAGFGADLVQIDGGHDAALDDAAQTWFHSGKQRLPAPPDHAALERLLRQADVVVDAWGVGVLDGLGFDAATLRACNPQVIVCRITPYGLIGPRRDWLADDITLYAASGLMHSTGDGARAPLNARPRVAELTAGMNACFASIGALLRRRRDGGGDDIDLAIAECAMDNYEVAIMEALALGKVARRNGDQHAMVPWRTYPCADGEAAIIGGPIRHWLKAAPMFEAPGLLDPALATMGERIARRAETEALMQPWLKTQTRQALFHAGQRAGLAWAPLASLTEALADPQHAARGYFIDAPGGGRMPGAPFRLQRGAWRDARTPAAPTPSAVPARHPLPPAGEANRTAPFAGLRVLDFTHDWAGPHAARLFADYGAEVIKIEYPRRLDGMRGGYIDRIDEHPRFWQLHRGKQSLTLDLRRDTHRAVLDHLLRDTDLVIENSRPGVMARKGYGFERLRSLNSRVVLLSMSAFGATGPYAQYCGYGGTLEAISGLQSLTAYDARSRWFRVREMDVMNGIMGACAAIIALWQREHDGIGQWIDLSENETTGWFVGEFFLQASRLQRQPMALGNRHAVHAPQGCYACAGGNADDVRWLALCVRSDAQWRSLAAHIGAPADLRDAAAAQRRARHDEIDVLLADWLRTHDAAHAADELQALGIAAAPVMTAADLVADDHLGARGWFLQVDGDRLPGLPFRYARGGGAVLARGPRLGAANAHWFGAAGQTPPTLDPDAIGTAYATA